MRVTLAERFIEEELYPIHGFSTYRVDKTGQVYSFRRKEINKLAQSKHRTGYLYVKMVDDDGVSKTLETQRVMARAFWPDKLHLQVNHLNGIKTDNRIENLEMCTLRENMMHARATGLWVPKCVLTEDQVYEIRYMRIYQNSGELAKEFGCSSRTIRHIRNGTTWDPI